MTDLAFHFGAPDRLAYACRLLRKAVGSGAHITVLADAARLQSLDGALWALSATEFLPHCMADAEPNVLHRSPVVLASELEQLDTPRRVLVNLSDAVPAGFDTFERLIEVVSLDATDREYARQRWRQYTALGYAIQRHDLQLKSNT